MLAVAAPFPDAVIRLVPYFRQVLQHRAFERPGAFVEFQRRHPRLVKRVDQLAIDIELQLGMRGIADANRLSAFVTR